MQAVLDSRAATGAPPCPSPSSCSRWSSPPWPVSCSASTRSRVAPIGGRVGRRGQPRAPRERLGAGRALELDETGHVVEVRARGPLVRPHPLRPWPARRPAWPRCSTAPRTSSGRSTSATSCSCSSRGRSPRRRAASPAARSSGPARSPRPSPSASPTSKRTSGCRPCGGRARGDPPHRQRGGRPLADREMVVIVRGRVAIDLELDDRAASSARPVAADGPGAIARRLRAAWTVGRLARALPHIADHLLAPATVELPDLTEVPALDGLTVRQLVALVERGREALRSPARPDQILLGPGGRTPGSSHFTGSLGRPPCARRGPPGRVCPTRRSSVGRPPVVLALTPPGIGRPGDAAVRPASPLADLTYDPPAAPDSQVRREALRLRVRWVQELTAQAACEIGRRLVARQVLESAPHVRHLRFDELARPLVAGRTSPRSSPGGRPRAEEEAHCGDAVPAGCRFQVTDRGLAVAVPLPPPVRPATAPGPAAASGPAPW